MERYVVVGEFSDQRTASRACSLLEDNDIPVMVDHLRAADADPLTVAFRVLVPVERSQSAHRTLSGLQGSYAPLQHTEADRPPLF